MMTWSQRIQLQSGDGKSGNALKQPKRTFSNLPRICTSITIKAYRPTTEEEIFFQVREIIVGDGQAKIHYAKQSSLQGMEHDYHYTTFQTTDHGLATKSFGTHTVEF